MDQNAILGLTQLYNPSTNTTQVSWSYPEDSDHEYYVLEMWDDFKRMWVPFDGKNGIIERQR